MSLCSLEGNIDDKSPVISLYLINSHQNIADTLSFRTMTTHFIMCAFTLMCKIFPVWQECAAVKRRFRPFYFSPSFFDDVTIHPPRRQTARLPSELLSCQGKAQWQRSCRACWKRFAECRRNICRRRGWGGGGRRKSDLKVFGLTANMKGLPVQCEHSQPETPADWLKRAENTKAAAS